MGRKIMIVPEPHISYANIEGRQDYVGEIKGYMQEVESIVDEDLDVTWACFVGDIFNRGFNDIDEYFVWVDWFTELDRKLQMRGGCIYSAIGNHELSFSKSNPFWRLTSLEDGGYMTTMKWNNKSAVPKGLRSIIKVDDVVEFSDNVSVFFCHYGAIQHTKELVLKHIEMYGSSKKRICICHNSIISSSIAQVLRDNYGRDPLTHFIEHERIDKLDFFHLFDYVFNGHMHKAYSQFTIKNEDTGHKAYLYYLGSLGRTNSEEINDNDLERCVPCYDVDNLTLNLYGIDLLSRSKALVSNYDFNKSERKVAESEYKEICRTIIDVGNPVKELMEALTDRQMIVALECAMSDEIPQDMITLINDARGII